MKKKKKGSGADRFLQMLGITIVVLALVRCVFPTVATLNDRQRAGDAEANGTVGDYPLPVPVNYRADGEKAHRIKSVESFDKAFPDSNHVQLVAARRWGVSPVRDRQDAEARKSELVYVGASPYYKLAKLDASIPYLVPHAALLLEDIARNFQDSLHVKGMPQYWLSVSSVLRSEADVKRLMRRNHNATEQSCHLFGTTFDISYNKYILVQSPGEPRRPEAGDVRLKQILSEVLNDLRQQGRCYVKYEKRQPCFHITVR